MDPKTSRTIRQIISLVCVIAISVGVYNIVKSQMEYRRGEQAYSQLNATVATEETVPETTVPPTTVPPTTEPEPDPYADVVFPEVDFEKLQGINDEIIAWIVNEGTKLDYPIAHTDNNDFYLEHMYDKKGNGSGCIFLDCDNAPVLRKNRNNILYGHNMKNGTMFNSIIGYKQQEYYEEHPYMLVMTPDHNYVMEIFSAYICNPEDGLGWMTEFDSDEDFHAWETNCRELSCIETDVKLSDEDSVVTLSTCTYEFYDARFLVQGILREVK